MSRAGIKDIAKKANVSIGTVDRVLHNRGQVSKKTKDKVLRIIDELNYVPNSIASSLATRKEYKIGVLFPTPVDKNTYWYYPAQGIEKAMKENRDYQIELLYSYFEINSTLDFTDKANTLLDQKPDGIITAPIYKEELLQIIENCDKSNIKFALLDSDIESTFRNLYIGQNTKQSGRVAANLFHYSLNSNSKTPPRILILRAYSIFQGIPTIYQREEGFREYFKETEFKTEIITETIEFKPGEDISNKIHSILLAYPNIDAIFIPNSKSHLIVPQLKGVSQRPLVIGFDVLDENRQLMKQGLIDFLISQRPVVQGYESLNTLLKILIEKRTEPVIKNIPIDIITRENLEAYDHLNL